MKCSHCSGDLQDTATTCPQCGADQDKQNQQYPATTFSYLPAGTPPWPTTIPGYRHEHETFATNQPAPVPTLLSSKRERKNTGFLNTLSILILMPVIGSLITLGLLYANGQFMHGSSSNSASTQGTYNNSARSAHHTDSSAPQPATPQTTSTPLATSEATQTATQTGPASTLPTTRSFRTYSNKDINMSLRYPSDWSLGQTSHANNVVTTLPLQPPQNYGMQIYIEHLTNAFSAFFNDASELNRRNIQSLFQLQNVHDIQKLSSPDAKPTIADATWEQADTTLQVGTSPKLHFTTISVQHNGSYYSTYFLIPENIYQDAMQKYIQPLLASIKFLS